MDERDRLDAAYAMRRQVLVEERDGPPAIGAVTADGWERFAATEPGADFTRIFPFVSVNPFREASSTPCVSDASRNPGGTA